jgi:hypothetical protein
MKTLLELISQKKKENKFFIRIPIKAFKNGNKCLATEWAYLKFPQIDFKI